MSLSVPIDFAPRESGPSTDDKGASTSAVKPEDAAERKHVLRKLDKTLLPFISFLYLLSFLDRSNIGNAKVAGMAKDMNLVGLQYNVIAAVFFVTYALGEVPSNIILKLIRPSRWIPSIMLAWGTVMTLMSLCHSFEGLLVARLFLGLTEAGLFPGVTYYLSLWYPRSKQAMRISIFFAAATMAGAFGGLLAFCIIKMEGIGGRHGWQWIFCLEGLLTILVAIAAFFFMHDFPETATFLTHQERDVVIAMLREEDQLSTRFELKFIRQAILDYKTWLHVGLYMAAIVPMYSVALFVPVIIYELGFSAARALLLTIPPFAMGCVATIAVGVTSDRLELRGPFIVGGGLVSLVGFTLLYTQTKPRTAYVGAVLATIGVFPTIPVEIAWAGGNAGGSLKRAVTLGIVIGIANLGGICSSFIYIHAPRFHVGHGTCMACLCLLIVLGTVLMWIYNRLNKEKLALCKRDGIDMIQKEKFQDMGDQSPLFRYTL